MAIKIQGTEVISDNRELSNIKFGLDNMAFPTADGANGQILATDGNGQLTFITDANDIDYINSASFDTANGVLTLSGVGNAGATVDLDGRYLTSYTETDTLDSVTGRGNTTTNSITVSSLELTANSALSIGIATATNLNSGNPADRNDPAAFNKVIHLHHPETGNVGAGIKFTRLNTGSTTTDGIDIGINNLDNFIIFQNENAGIALSTNKIERFFLAGDGTLSLSGVVNVTNTTASSNTTNGALTVSGGVGVAGNLNVGGNISVTGTVDGVDVAALATEVNTIETSAGLNSNGTYTPPTTTTYTLVNTVTNTPYSYDTSTSFYFGSNYAWQPSSNVTYKIEVLSYPQGTLIYSGIGYVQVATISAFFATNLDTPVSGLINNANYTYKIYTLNAVPATYIASAPSLSGADLLLDTALTTKADKANPTFTGLLSAEALAYSYQSTVTFTVTVGVKDATHPQYNNGSTNGYKINGGFAPFLHMVPGMTYRFDQSDASNSGHPIAFYYDEQKASSYTSGVTNNGTPGSAGAYTEIVISESTPATLYYQCAAHSLMGWGIGISTHNLTGFDTDDISEGSTNLYYSTTRFNTDFSNKSTTSLSEGTNLYYTTARARSAISGTGDISYNTTTGVISFNNTSGYLTSETYSTANELLTAIKTVDGTTSGLDSDLLDGQQGSYYLDYANFTSKPTSILDFGITDGNAGQVLQTDGSGNFSFTTVSGGGGTQAGYAGYEDYYYNVTSNTTTFGTAASTHDKVQVFKNGVYIDDSAWSFNANTGIVTLNNAAVNGDEIAIWGFNSTTLNNHELFSVDSSGNVTLPGTLQIGNHRKEGSLTSTIATTNPTNVVMYTSANYVGAKLIMSITDGTTGDTQITEALILTVNGGTPKITTYGTMYTSTNALASFDVANVSTNTALEVTMASANNSTVKVAYTLIDA